MTYNIYQKIGGKSLYPLGDVTEDNAASAPFIDGFQHNLEHLHEVITRQEDAYWRLQPTLAAKGEATDYERYRTAYLYGVRAFLHFRTPPFELVEASLQANWHEVAPDTPLSWEEAKHAVRAAYTRLFGYPGLLNPEL